MGGEFGGEWIHVYVWLSPFSFHLKLSQLCQSALLQYKIAKKKKKKTWSQWLIHLASNALEKDYPLIGQFSRFYQILCILMFNFFILVDREQIAHPDGP